MKDLICIETKNIEFNTVGLFTSTGMKVLLEKISTAAISFVPNIKIEQGRKDIKDVVKQLTKTSKYLDGLGKELVTDWKAQAKGVDKERKVMRDFIETLKSTVRKPLTEWEEIEQCRVNNLKLKIQSIIDRTYEIEKDWIELTLNTIKLYKASLETLIIDDSWEEFKQEGLDVQQKSLVSITKSLQLKIDYDKQQEELEQLRIKQKVQEKKDYEAELKKEGEIAATKKYENKLSLERAIRQNLEDLDRKREYDLQNRAFDINKKDIKKYTSNTMEEEIQKYEQQLQESKTQEVEEETEIQVIDPKYKLKVLNKASKALAQSAELSNKKARFILEIIDNNLIPNVHIKY